ncbi:MAG TPA: tetratricopeptide repeat protein, partial [Candidatus Angelobacter sp.]
MVRSKTCSICEKACVVVLALLFLCCCSVSVSGKPPTRDSQDQISSAQKLATEERWQELLQLVEAIPQPSPEMEYYHGLALAHLERWDDARRAFLVGRRALPRDKRFPTELAGVAFRQKNYSRAAAYLRAALRLDPADAYVNDFLGTVYFIEGNLEAALKYWNRAGKPGIEEVRTGARLHINPVLLDHAFAFSPASILQREELLASEARLDALEIFPVYRLDLLARSDEKFDLQFQPQEKNGFGNT